jgi:hypothetical protein
MDHQKSSILLIFGTISVGGCGGHGCYFQPNPRVISQMLSCLEHAESYKQFLNSSELIEILVYFITFCGGTPCKTLCMQ